MGRSNFRVDAFWKLLILGKPIKGLNHGITKLEVCNPGLLQSHYYINLTYNSSFSDDDNEDDKNTTNRKIQRIWFDLIFCD